MRELAPAKVNLFLAVGPRRPDGYHELLTLFEEIPLADDVVVHLSTPGVPRPESGFPGQGNFPGNVSWEYRVRARWARASGDSRSPWEAPSDAAPDLPRDLDNLAGRAARDFVEAVLPGLRTPLGPGPEGPGWPMLGPRKLSIEIAKRIPVAAGLGGGSSDAAAVLRAMSRLSGIAFGGPEVRAVAAKLGSDVPFFLQGGRAAGRSRGEVLTPVPGRAGLPLILGLPSFPLATGEVYSEFDRLVASGDMAPDWEEREEKLRALLRALDLDDLQAVAGCLRNDLQRAAVSLRPEVGGALRALRQAGCAAGLVSGSGPAVFGLAPRRLDARSLDELAAEASARLREGDPLTGRRAAGTYRFIGLPPVQGLSPPGGEP